MKAFLVAAVAIVVISVGANMGLMNLDFSTESRNSLQGVSTPD